MDKLRHIVVPTDFSAIADAAFARAASLARTDGAAIHLVHALTFPLVITSSYECAMPPGLWEDLRAAARERLEQMRKAGEAKGLATVTAHVTDAADAVDAIEEAVRTHRADLVVMGTHGRGGLQHAFLGSVAERALRRIDLPILAVKEDARSAAKPIAKILLAVDFSPHSERAATEVADLAARLSASVDVVHALELPRDYDPYLSAIGTEIEGKIEAGVTARLEQIRQQLAGRGIAVRVHLLRGRPEEVIADAARRIGCQLIAMGTRGLSGLSHVLIGSVAERTLRIAPCSVLCVKQ